MNKYIINADDFGQNSSCTNAIKEAMQKGLITDTTMIANGECFKEAVLLATQNEEFINSVGIHFNLTEGKPLTKDILSFPQFTDGECFHGKVNRIKPLSKGLKKAVYKELSTQAEKIKNAGVKISHADSHHHIHTGIFIAPIVAKVCKEQGIDKVRLHRNIGSISKLKMIIKSVYNNWLGNRFITTDYFGSAEDEIMPNEKGVVEIMVHPEYDKNGCLIDCTEWEKEFLEGMELVSAVKPYVKNQISYGEIK